LKRASFVTKHAHYCKRSIVALPTCGYLVTEDFLIVKFRVEYLRLLF